MSENNRVQIGQIVGAFGIKGEVKVDPTTAFASRFVRGKSVYIKGQKFTIESSRWHKERPLLRLSGIDSIDKAEALQWEYLEADGQPKLAKDEFLVEDLLGLKVTDVTTGEYLGTVQEVQDYPAHQVLAVGEIMIPLVKAFVKDIDFEAGTMQVALIYGMRPGELDE